MTEENIKPNFFIIGGPKCGTTSLAHYLSEHPDILFSKPKEPNFFNDEVETFSKRFKGVNDYLEKCFPDVDEYSLVGEGSVQYLHSPVAVKNILAFNPDAKFIVMVRNPVDMAVSWHAELVRRGSAETESFFQNAWYLQESRKARQNIPKECPDVSQILYGEMCKLGKQLERVYEQVPAERVHVIVFGDFKMNTKKEYEKLLDFLEVKQDGRQDFPRLNERKEIYGSRFYRWLRRKVLYTRSIRVLFSIVKKVFGIKNWSTFKKLYPFDKKEITQSSLDPDFKKELQDYFREDVKLLSKLLDRDLMYWVDE